MLALVALLLGGPAQAHKVVASAWVEGTDLVGEIGFSNGKPAPPGTLVEVFDHALRKLGETATAEDGLFRFSRSNGLGNELSGEAVEGVALTVRSDLGAGHLAEIRLSPAEAAPLSGRSASDALQGVAETLTPTDSELRALIAEAVRQEVQPLRREIVQLKERAGLQQILGGIGYIAGLFGLLFFVYGRRPTRG
ncbi:MAG: cobalt ABC transporter permease [Gammaproteobacteria bacterium]|nr:cobalt ABC transporter permease [Gammaproteobacteria bacterium]